MFRHPSCNAIAVVVILSLSWTTPLKIVAALSSSFHGATLRTYSPVISSATLTMRKQKASDRRTRRLQRGGEELIQEVMQQNLRVTQSPMDQTGQWRNKKKPVRISEKTGGRGRARKRATLYNSLSGYHNRFLQLLTKEYRAEVSY